MQQPVEQPLPDDEAERLASLARMKILDTPREERFDRITRLAARAFGVPIVAISLVDRDRQWFKSTVGLEVRETPREISFCAYALAGADALVIPDAARDERFADNPLVKGDLGIRFYAGHPVHSPEGRCVGTLCIIDRRPRELSAEDTELLRDLAGVVEDELRIRALSELQAHLLEDLDAARRQAMVDDLTEIWNRSGIVEMLERELGHAVRDGRRIGLLMADLDDFKRINDRHGHPVGDAVLREAARRMQKALRPYDGVGRYGGEEFMVVVVDGDAGRVAAIAERVRRCIGEYPFVAGDQALHVTTSIGLAMSRPEDGVDHRRLIRAADQALYAAKGAGRDRVMHAGD